MLRIVVALALVALVTGCSKKDEAPAKDTPAPSQPAEPDEAPVKPAEKPPEKPPEPAKLPAQADIQQGKVYWAVYFANVPPDTPLYADANTRLEAIGFHEGDVLAKDAGCDIPVEGQDPPSHSKAVGAMLLAAYYEAEADARAVAARYGGDPAPWVGQVKTMCLD